MMVSQSKPVHKCHSFNPVSVRIIAQSRHFLFFVASLPRVKKLKTSCIGLLHELKCCLPPQEDNKFLKHLHTCNMKGVVSSFTRKKGPQAFSTTVPCIVSILETTWTTGQVKLLKAWLYTIPFLRYEMLQTTQICRKKCVKVGLRWVDWNLM